MAWILFVVAHAADLFAEDLVAYNLAIEPEALAGLRARPCARLGAITCEENTKYVPCTLTARYGTAEAREFTGAGCRYKGHGSLKQCTGVDGALAEGTASCRRASWAVQGTKFGGEMIEGLAKLNFDGMQTDLGLMGERLAYTTLNELGLNISRASGALVFVNDAEQGIYNLVEPVDAQWLAHRGLRGTLLDEVWMQSDDVAAYDASIKVGAKGTGAAQPLVDLKHAAEACLGRWRGCSAAEARQIVQQYTDEESFLQALVAQGVFFNFDQFTTFYGGHTHNFFLLVEEETQKIAMVPWDYSETLRTVWPFLDYHPGAPQPLGLYPWFVPVRQWYDVPSKAEMPAACRPDQPVQPFACDPVGHVMALAWRDLYLERFATMFTTDMQRVPPFSPLERANTHVCRWSLAYRAPVARGAARGELPSEEAFEERSAIALQMYASGITELGTRALLAATAPSALVV